MAGTARAPLGPWPRRFAQPVGDWLDCGAADRGLHVLARRQDGAEGDAMEIERKLAELGLELPNPPQPVANYVGAVQVGDLLFIGGVSNRWNGVLKYRGKVGGTISLEEAYDAARMCCLNHLAVIKATLGDLDRVERIVKVVVHVNSAPGFNKQPLVANGQSDLLVQLYGERGRHARSAVGMQSLPRGITVEIEMIVQLEEGYE